MAIAIAAWREAKLISFFLPINDLKEMFAANAVLEAITKQFGGYTRSSMKKGSKMMGRYQSDNLQGYIDDWIVHVLVITRTKDAEARLAELHVQVHEEYAAQESPQEAVWILGQPVPLLADGIDG